MTAWIGLDVIVLFLKENGQKYVFALHMAFKILEIFQPSTLSFNSFIIGRSSLNPNSLPLTSLKESSEMTQLMVVMILMICLGIAGLLTIMYLRIVQQRRMSKV